MTTKENLLKNLEKLYKNHEMTITAYYVISSGIHQLELTESGKESK